MQNEDLWGVAVALTQHFALPVYPFDVDVICPVSTDDDDAHAPHRVVYFCSVEQGRSVQVVLLDVVEYWRVQQ